MVNEQTYRTVEKVYIEIDSTFLYLKTDDIHTFNILCINA